MNVLIVFHSMWGHMHKMAEAAAEGARLVPGATVKLARVPETLPTAVLEKMGAVEPMKAFSHIPEAGHADLEWAHAIIFGVSTRFGGMTAQMKSFFDSTGTLWSRNALVGKVGSVMTSTATQHGGQETALLSTHVPLLHQGLVIVGLPYSYKGQMSMDGITGGSPYGATTISGGDGSRQPSANELEAARYQGRHVAELAAKLFR